MGLRVPPAAEIRRTIGLSLPDTLVRLAGDEYRPRAEEFRSFFRTRSDQIMVAWTEVLPGVVPAIRGLERGGFNLGIVSTKFRFRIEATLRREGLLDPFATIVGGDDVERFKPDPEGLLMASERMGVSPDQMVYVGDSVTDAETAQRAAVPFIALLSGTTSREEFAHYAPRSILTDITQLAAQLNR